MLTLGPTDTLHAQAGQADAITLTADGDVIDAGSDTFGVIAQSVLSATAAVVISASTGQRLIKRIALQNVTDTNTTARFWVNGTANSNSWFACVIPPNGSALYGPEGWSLYDSSGFRQYVGATGPAGADGSAAASFEFPQVSPASTWTINHNLGFRPTVGVFSAGGMEVEADVLHTTLNQTVITFNAPFAGFARLV